METDKGLDLLVQLAADGTGCRAAISPYATGTNSAPSAGQKCGACLPLAVIVGMAILSVPASALAALQRGDRSPAVTTLQTELKQLGYFDGPITGYYGSLTQAAVVGLQAKHGLTTDGVVGSKTQAVLNQLQSASAPAPSQPLTQGGMLQRGSRGDTVVQLQQRLTSLGYPLPATGYFGGMTEAAVLQFQRDRGLKADALVGLATRAALDQARPVATNPVPAGSGSLRQGNSGDPVAAVQKRLANLGYFSASTTGYFGPITRTAVMNFQRDYRLQVDGIVGANTLAALGMGDAKVAAVR
jgi:peptidoglycan hydrolase-like protein with peptidoglycan-binding domain